MKYAQAVISRMEDGRWKVFVQSDKGIENMLIGDLDSVIQEIRQYSCSEWEQRGKY